MEIKHTAVVTGGAQGIGRRTAELLAVRGYRLAIIDLRYPQDVVEAIEKKGGEAMGFAGDITDEATVGRFARQVFERWGAVDVLVNNAVDPTCTYCTGHAPVKRSSTMFWGLGWGIEQLPSGKYLWHWGDNDVYKSFVAIDLNRRNAVVYFTNSQNGMAIAPALVRETIGGDHPVFPWLRYDSYDSAGMRLTLDAAHHGSEALKTYDGAIRSRKISEDTMEAAGYLLLDQKKYQDAIAVFERNAEIYPEAAGAWDGLGDAYAGAGQRENAVRCYEKELALDPTRQGATIALSKLRSGAAANNASHDARVHSNARSEDE